MKTQLVKKDEGQILGVVTLMLVGLFPHHKFCTIQGRLC
jgi:hypothetical protein